VTWADVVKPVKQRQWTINEAWALISSSAAANSGLHPDVHVISPEHPGASDRHFLTRKDYKRKEYRDRARHSVFRNAWEAAGALCAALNSDAGEYALTVVPSGKVLLRSRSALVASPQQFERLRLEYQGQTTGVSYFEAKCDFVFLFLLCSEGLLSLKTAYPATGGPNAPPSGQDVVEQSGSTFLFPART